MTTRMQNTDYRTTGDGTCGDAVRGGRFNRSDVSFPLTPPAWPEPLRRGEGPALGPKSRRVGMRERIPRKISRIAPMNPVGTRSTTSPIFSRNGDAVERVPTTSERRFMERVNCRPRWLAYEALDVSERGARCSLSLGERENSWHFVRKGAARKRSQRWKPRPLSLGERAGVRAKSASKTQTAPELSSHIDPAPHSQSAFTMIEIAICLAVIGFALASIVGVLPL